MAETTTIVLHLSEKEIAGMFLIFKLGLDSYTGAEKDEGTVEMLDLIPQEAFDALAGKLEEAFR